VHRTGAAVQTTRSTCGPPIAADSRDSSNGGRMTRSRFACAGLLVVVSVVGCGRDEPNRQLVAPEGAAANGSVSSASFSDNHNYTLSARRPAAISEHMR